MSETTTTEKKKRDLPLWLGILLIAIGVAAAGWFIWSQVSGFWSGPSGVFVIEGVEPGSSQVRRPPPGQPRPQVNVREISKTEWRARTPAFNADAKKAADGKLQVTMSASSMRVLPADAQWVVIARSRLDAATGTQLGLSAEQVKQFKALPTNIRNQLVLNDAQTQQLAAAYQKYLDAQPQQRPAAEQELANAINTTGQAALPALTQQLQAQYDQFKKTITPEQWTRLRELATKPPSTPAP